MDIRKQRKLKNLSYKLMTEAALKIEDLEMSATAIIPFCVMMLETTLEIMSQSRKSSESFAKNCPETFIDDAMEMVLVMFKVKFGKEIIAYQEKEAMSREQIRKEVDEFLKNLPKKGEKDEKS